MNLFSIVFYLSTVFFLLGILFTPRGSLKSFFKLPRTFQVSSSNSKFYGSMILTWFGGLIIQGAISDLFTFEYKNTIANDLELGVVSWVWVTMFAGVVFPILEELSFRGYIFEIYNKFFNSNLIAAIFMALLFGFGHPHFLSSGLFALFALEMRLKTDSLIIPIAIHMLINLSSLSLIYFSFFFTPNNEPLLFKENIFLLIIGAGVLLLGFYILPKRNLSILKTIAN